MNPAETVTVEGAPDDYHPADEQLHSTTGLDVGSDGVDEEVVEEADDETTKAVIDAIERPNQPREGEESDPSAPYSYLPERDLPGFGEPLDDCGANMPVFCDGCGATHHVSRTCKRSECPRCGAAWCRDRAVNVAARLDACRRWRNHQFDEHQRFHHVTLSPPVNWMLEADDPLGKTYEVISEILDCLGIEGYVFYHPYRGRTRDGEDDRGRWRQRIFSGRDWEGDVRGEVRLSPHFHVIAVGHKVRGGELTRRVEEETGWVINRITESESSKVSLYDDEAMCRAVTYCVSHTGIGDRVEYRKFGFHLNEADVHRDKKRRIDLLVRKTAPKTLGVDLGEQICEKETAPGFWDDGVTSAAAMLNDGEEHGEDSEGSSSGDDGGSDASSTGSELPDGQEPGDTERGPGKETCEGRLLPIKAAHRNPKKYHENPSWAEQAEHVDDLQRTLDAYADDIDDLPG
jgi:hypothetical protein